MFYELAVKQICSLDCCDQPCAIQYISKCTVVVNDEEKHLCVVIFQTRETIT